MFVTEDIRYIGVNDHDVDLFEGQYTVENGMSYNSYVILDEKVAVMDTVDAHFGVEWLQNLETELNGRRPDYLVVQHMEPDHSANIAVFILRHGFPGAQGCRRRGQYAQARSSYFDVCHRAHGALAGGYRHIRQYR